MKPSCTGGVGAFAKRCKPRTAGELVSKKGVAAKDRRRTDLGMGRDVLALALAAVEEVLGERQAVPRLARAEDRAAVLQE